MEHAVGTLKRLLHTHYLIHRIVNTQHIDIQGAGIADNTEDGHVNAVDLINLKAPALKCGTHLGLIFLWGSRFEYNYHKSLSFKPDAIVSLLLKKQAPRKENLL